MYRARGFTLIEIAISVFILMILMLLAIPSVNGVLSDRRLQRSLTSMNEIVRQAQAHSVGERRPYLIIWEKDAIVLRPEAREKGDPEAPVAQVALDRGHAFLLQLPSALQKAPLAQWIFWPSGTCEPATVSFKGPDGTWQVDYSPLSAQPKVVRYAAK